MLVYELLLVSLFSFFLATLASFFNVVIYRTSREESFVSGRSKCESCHRQIAWYDNIPLLSFLILGGRCRHCYKPIASAYFLTELVSFLAGFALYFAYLNLPVLRALPLWQLITGFLLGFVLFFIFLSDLQYLLIPDFLVLLLSLLAVFYQFKISNNWLPALAAVLAVLFFTLLYFLAKKILNKEALGVGDIKLMVPLAILLSWPKVVLAIFLAFIIGGFFAMLVLAFKRKKLGQSLPFAPFLIIATLLSLFFGETIWQWYFGLLM